MIYFPKKILFVGDGNPIGYIFMRSQSIKKLVQSMDMIDHNEYINPKNKISYCLAYRFQLDYLLKDLNKTIIQMVNAEPYDLVWFEKPIFILRKTLEHINNKNISTVSLNPDNPFGPRDDGCWNLYLKNINLYKHHITARRSNVRDLKNMGAKSIYFMPLCYEKSKHFKEQGTTENKKEFDVTFIGNPYDNRIDFIDQLSKKVDVTIHLYSPEWKKFNKTLGSRKNIIINDGIYHSEYRKIINQSKIVLGFITKSNLDKYSIRSFEITACGSFLLSERTRFQKKFFREDKEAGYFDDVEECAEKINYYLANPLERIKLELAGHKRVKELNLNNDYVVKRLLLKLFRDPK